MMKLLAKLGIGCACVLSLSACMTGHVPPGERTIRYAYCTDMQGNVVQDPGAAVEKGKALRCYNFLVQ